MSVSLFNLIRIPLTLLPWAIIDTIKMIVSINRIQAFLNAEELNTECIGQKLQYPLHNAIELRDATLAWNTEKRQNFNSEQATGTCSF